MRIWVDVITWVQRRKHFNQDTFPSTFVLVRVICVLCKSPNKQVRKDRRVNKLKSKPESIKKDVLTVFCRLNLAFTLQQVGRYSPIRNQSPAGFIGVCMGSHWASHRQSWKDSLPDKKKKGKNPRWEVLHQGLWELCIEGVSLHGGIAIFCSWAGGREGLLQCLILMFIFCFRIFPVRDCPIFSPKKGS